MGITVANIIAQVGADLTQFRIGMREVDARINLVEVRARQAEARGKALEASSHRAGLKAAELAKQRTAINITPLKKEVTDADKLLKAANANTARLTNNLSAARTLGVQAIIDQATKDLATNTKEISKAEKALEKAKRELDTANSKRSSLLERENTQKRLSVSKLEQAGSLGELAAAQNQVAREYAARLEQNAKEHRTRAANAVANQAQIAGEVLAGGLAIATKVGADFNQMLVTTAHNTSLSAAGVGIMNDAVKKLGQESGGDMQQLADGFRVIENTSYGAADAVKILTPAMQAAIAKGSDLGATTLLLTNVMKEFNIPVERASDVMGLLVETSRRSKTDMSQLVHVFGQMSATSANMGVSLAETSAAYVVFTRHGLDASAAATQFKNDVNKIINPSKATQNAIANIFKATGVDLSKDFSAAGLRFKQLSGVWADIKEAASKFKGGVLPADLVTKLFPLQRGQLGAAISTGTGFAEYGKVLDEIKASAHSGQTVNNLYQESLQQINQQMDRLKNAGIVAASSISSALSPSIRGLTDFINNAVGSFNKMSEGQKESIAQFAAFTAGILILTGVVGKLIVGIVSLNTALAAMGFGGIGGLIVTMGPWILLIGAAIAGIALLAKTMYDLEHTAERLDARLHASVVANNEHAAAQLTNATRTTQLVDEFSRLHARIHPTTQAMHRMQEIMDEITRTSPDLVNEYNRQGHAIGLIADAADRAALAQRGMAHEAAIAASAISALQTVDIAQKRGILSDKREELKSTLDAGYVMQPGPPRYISGGMGGAPVAVPTQVRHMLTPTEYGQTASKILDLTNQIAALNHEYDASTHATRRAFNTDVTRRGGNMSNLQRDFADNLQKLIDASHGQISVYSGFRTEERQAELFRQAVTKYGSEAAARKHVAPPGHSHHNLGTAADLTFTGGGAAFARANAAKFGLHFPGTAESQRRGGMANEPWHIEPISSTEFNIAGGPTGNGIDKTHGLTDAAKKAKKPKHVKESEEAKDARRESDRYQALMEGFVQSTFMATHQGKEGEALWETMTHGTIRLKDGIHVVTGEFANYNKVLRDNLILAARHADQLAANEKYKEFVKSNRLKQFEDSKGITGKDRTPFELEMFKLQNGEYDQYGKHKGQVAMANVQDAELKRAAKASEQIKKLNEEANKPLTQQLSVHDDMLKQIKDNTEAYEKLGAKGAEALAALAQHNSDVMESMKLMKDETKSLDEELNKLQLKQRGDQSNVGAKYLELQKEAYNKLSIAEKLELLVKASRLDVLEKEIDLEKAHKAVQDSIKERVDQSRADLAGASNPQGQAFMEYRQRMLDKYNESLGKLTDQQRIEQEGEIQRSFDEIQKNAEKEKQLHKVSDVMEEISKANERYNEVIFKQAGGVTITRKVWDQLSASQKDAVKQFERFAQVKETVGGILQGLEGIFSQTLDNIREHGFRNFFRDILAGFDNMLYEMAKKWAEAQFAKAITNGLTGLLGGLLGGAGGTDVPTGDATSGIPSFDYTPPIADAGLSRAASFVNAPSNSRSASSGNNNTFNLHVHGVSDAKSFEHSRHQIMQTLHRAVNATQQR